MTAAYAMQIMTLLFKANVPLDVIQSGAGGQDDAMLAVLAGIMVHDVGQCDPSLWARGDGRNFGAAIAGAHVARDLHGCGAAYAH
ncbi:MAG: hypothetical protein V9G11_06820 [Bifidobacterium adolescentis]